jgi:hypothetical protein
VSLFSEGLARVEDCGWNRRYGYVDINVEPVTGVVFREAGCFKDGRAYVETKNKKCGFIDKTGKIIIKTPQQGGIGAYFCNGLAVVRYKTGYMYIDINSGVKIDLTSRNCEYVLPFEDSKTAIIKINGLYGFIGRDGSEITPVIYEDCHRFKDGFAVVKEPGETGRTVKWQGCWSSGERYETLGEWKSIKYDGATHAILGKYYHMDNYSEGHLYAQKYGDEKRIDYTQQEDKIMDFYDVIDICGKIKYSGINSGWSVSEGRIRCCDGWKRYFLSVDNVPIPDVRYNGAMDFSEGMAYVQILPAGADERSDDNNWGYINREGIVIIEPMYEKCSCFKQGVSAVKMNGKWGYIDKSARKLTDFRYDRAGSFNEGFAWVQEDNKWGILELISCESV